MFDIKTTSAVATWPVTLTEVKTHLHLTDSDNDTQLTDLYKQVSQDVELYCGIAIGTQTKVWTFDFCPGEEYVIPYNPVASITSITRKDDIGTYGETLTANEDYELDGELMKTLKIFGGGRCKVTYVTGTAYATCPHSLKLGILNEIAYRYENRGDEKKDGFCVEALNLIMKYKDFSWE